MSEEWENEETKKATASIEKDLYLRVKKHFHHGQQSTLFRNIFESIDEMIKNGQLMEIVNYIYKNNSLLLVPKKD